MIRVALAFLMLPTVALADGITVANPMVPLAPASARAHAAYFTLTNDSAETRQVIGVSADGYRMAHLHVSKEENGVATMASVDVITLEPGQSVAFEQGGLHIMLMGPKAPLTNGGDVTFSLEFANGEVVPVTAKVMKRKHGHNHGHAHDS